MKKLIKSLRTDKYGSSAAEYALILGLVGSGVALAAFTLSETISNAIDDATACISSQDGTCTAVETDAVGAK